MMKQVFFSKVLFAISAAVLVSSCSKETDLYDEGAKKRDDAEKTKTEYATNFAARYGSYAGKSWDFTKGRRLGTRAAGDGVELNVIEEGFDFAAQGTFVNNNYFLYEAIRKALPDDQYHTGKNVVLVSPGNTFYLYPLTTRSMYTHDLMVKVGDNAPVKLYHKDWTDYSRNWANGMSIGAKTIKMPGLKVDAPVGTRIEIYLANVNGDPKANMGTTNGYAYYTDVPSDVKIDLPEAYQVSKDAVVKYIGFEDEWNGDHDCNDMVMAIVGDPAVPEEVIITNEEYTVETNNSKRYMVEDLGKTDDFDFNDVVVDMCQTFTEKHKVTLVNGVIQSDVIVEKIVSPQKAVIRALGGTLDFILTIGNTSWTKSGAGFDFKTMYNTGEDGQAIDYQKELASFEVTGWIPEQNNISLKVKEPKKGDIDIAFPRVGSAPMIIATNPDRNWMKERESVPKAWFE